MKRLVVLLVVGFALLGLRALAGVGAQRSGLAAGGAPYQRLAGVQAHVALAPDQLNAPALAPEHSAGWGDLMTETFEGAFPGARWRLYGNPTWARTTYRRFGGTASGYPVAGGANAVNPPGPYPANVASWMVAGPFDLTTATDAELNYYHWTKTEFTSDSKHDDLCIYGSEDGENFHGECLFGTWTGTAGNVNGWNPASFDLTNIVGLGSLLGHDRVWVAFAFASDGSVSTEGAYLDNIALRIYTGPTPTPTPATPTPTPQVCPGANHMVYITQDDNEDNALSGRPDNDIYPGTDHCIYQNDPRQPIEFRIIAPHLPPGLSSAQLSLRVWDVDEQDPECPEVDTVRFNGAVVGKLTGADMVWSTTALAVPPAAVQVGGNLVQVTVNTSGCLDVDNPSNPAGRWCTQVDWGQIVLAGAGAAASLRSVATDFACYAPGATLNLRVEVDTPLASQEVRVEANLLDAAQNNLAGETKTQVIHASQDDAFLFALAIPAAAQTADHTLQIIVYDACSENQSAYREMTIRLDPACATPTPTPSLTPTRTPSLTPTRTPSLTPTRTPSLTPTRTPSLTPTPSATLRASPTPSATLRASPSATLRASPSATLRASPSATLRASPTPSSTPIPSLTSTPTPTPPARLPVYLPLLRR